MMTPFYVRETAVSIFEMGPGQTVVDDKGLLDFSVKQPFYIARCRYGMAVARTGPEALALAERLITKAIAVEK